MKVNFEFDVNDPQDRAVFQRMAGGIFGAKPAEAPVAEAPAPTPPAPAQARSGKVAPPPPAKPPTTAQIVANGEDTGGEEGSNLEQQLRDALQEYNSMTNAVTVATFLRKELGFPNISSIPADKFAECLEKTQQKLAEAAMQ